VTYSLRPWLERIEQTVNPLLYRPAWVNRDAEIFCRFNAEGLMRGDLKARMEAYEVGIRSSMYTPNRCLALEDEPPYPEGDLHYAALNYYAVENGPPANTNSTTEPAIGGANEKA
jgi:phage portal protein BeeE